MESNEEFRYGGREAVGVESGEIWNRPDRLSNGGGLSSRSVWPPGINM